VTARELAEDVHRCRQEMKQYEHTNVLTEGSGRNEVVYHVKNGDVLQKLEKIRRSK
jgi:predicted RNA-binding protein with PIN domain